MPHHSSHSAWSARRRAISIRIRTACLTLALAALLHGGARAETNLPPPKTIAPPAAHKPTVLDQVAPYRRCLWVTRWDWRTRQDIERICYNAASARFTDVFFQVRGAGTVFYASALEPWAGELSGDPIGHTGWNPGWDPLATAVKEGHRWGLRVHAYLNVLPGWSHDEAPPAATRQLYAVHRSWFMMDEHQRRMQPGNWYAFLDPGLPEVRNHVAALAREVAAKYAVDGIHLDYIRYPQEAGDFSYNRSVVDAFKQQTGASPQSRPEAWRTFRQEQVSATVKAISEAARAARPGIELSAAVLGDLNKGRNEACQSALVWVRKGWLDAIAPMVYTDDMDQFARLCRQFEAPEIKKHVWLGVWADPERNSHLKAEVIRAADKGFGAVSVFCYSDLFPSHQASARATQVYQAFVREIAVK